MKNKKSIIEVRDLEFQYGSNLIFSHVSFTINEGDFISFTGANGSGKSTLVNLLLGEKSPKKGKIKLFNEDIDSFEDWWKIGYVPQSGFGFNKDFPASCQEIVSTNLYKDIGPFKLANKAHRERILQALDLVGMKENANKLISQLSGGQIQRVMIARVLVNNPEIMILDEPTAGIDAQTIELLYELLWKLNKEKNITILMVTHDTANTVDYTNRFLCLEEGSLVELDKEDMIKELAHKHVHPKLNFIDRRGC